MADAERDVGRTWQWIAAGLVASALLALAAAAVAHRSEAPVALGPVALRGFEACGDGCFRAVDAPDRFHLIEAELAPVAGDDYTLALAVRRLPGAAVTLGADFFAWQYDDDDQEAFVPLDMAALERGVAVGWNAGVAPASARVRLFYTGPPGVELGAPRLAHSPRWVGFLRRAWLGAAAATAFAVAVLVAIAAARRVAASPRRGELTVLAALYFALVALRTLQFIATPLWAGDEYAYKSIAAAFFWLDGVGPGGLDPHRIAHSVAFPNLVYPALISPAFFFAADFHAVLRAINAALLCAALFPAFALARRFLSAGWSLGFAGFAVAIPFTSLGAFALTEVAFYPLFLVWAWAALRALAPEVSPAWPALAGALVGVLANVRPNAPVLLAVTALALLLAARVEGRKGVRALRDALLVAPGAFLVVAASIHAATHGGAPFELGLYDEMRRKAEAGSASFAFGAYLDLALGHLAGIAVPYGLPVVLAAVGLGAAARGRWRGEDARFALLALLAAAGLVASALAFTLGVASYDLGGLGRWHARYYFHATPLLLLAGVVAARRAGFGAGRERAIVLGATSLLLALGAVFVLGRAASESPWFGSIVDGMDVRWLRHHEGLFLVFAAATLGVAGLVCVRSPLAARAAALALACWLVVANRAVLDETRLGEADPAADCGRMAGLLLESAPGRFAIAADERAAAVQTGFAIPFLPQRVVWGTDLMREWGGGPWLEVDYVVTYGGVAPAPHWRPVLEAGACRVYRAR